MWEWGLLSVLVTEIIVLVDIWYDVNVVGAQDFYYGDSVHMCERACVRVRVCVYV